MPCLATPSNGSPTRNTSCAWATPVSMAIPTRIHNCRCGSRVKWNGTSLCAVLRLPGGPGAGEVWCCNCRCEKSQRFQKEGARAENNLSLLTRLSNIPGGRDAAVLQRGVLLPQQRDQHREPTHALTGSRSREPWKTHEYLL